MGRYSTPHCARLLDTVRALIVARQTYERQLTNPYTHTLNCLISSCLCDPSSLSRDVIGAGIHVIAKCYEANGKRNTGSEIGRQWVTSQRSDAGGRRCLAASQRLAPLAGVPATLPQSHCTVRLVIAVGQFAGLSEAKHVPDSPAATQRRQRAAAAAAAKFCDDAFVSCAVFENRYCYDDD